MTRVEAARRAIDLGERCDESANTALGLSELAFGLMQAGRAQEAQAAIERAMRTLERERPHSFCDPCRVLNNGAMIEAMAAALTSGQLYEEALALSVSLDDREAAIGIGLNWPSSTSTWGAPTGRSSLQVSSRKNVCAHMKRSDLSHCRTGPPTVSRSAIPRARSAALDALQLARGAGTQHITLIFIILRRRGP